MKPHAFLPSPPLYTSFPPRQWPSPFFLVGVGVVLLSVFMYGKAVRLPDAARLKAAIQAYQLEVRLLPCTPFSLPKAIQHPPVFVGLPNSQSSAWLMKVRILVRFGMF